MAPKPKPNELQINRIYDAPVKVVWDAWTDPKQVAQWWGPRGFTLTHHSKELKVGGVWHYTMHGPDGTDYPNKTKYLEVEKYARLVYDHGGNDEQAPMFRVTVNFSENKGKTYMEMTMSLPSAEAAEETKKFVRKAGGDATWDRLAEHLAETTAHTHQFVINRTFDAPVELMYQMWTDPKHFSKWLAPTGMSMKFHREETRAGGTSFYSMTNGTNLTMYGRVSYQELKPTRLVYTQQFCDEKENVSRHPLAPTWPETMLTVVTFTEEAPGRTRVTIVWEPYGKTSAEELATFLKERGGMTQGWTGSFDKLEVHLKEVL